MGSRGLAVLLVALGAATCLAQDGFDEAEEHRTAMLDRLADEGMPMLRVSNNAPRHDSNLGESAGTDTEKPLGNLGESDSERAELQADVKEATAETEGMYDSDVRAARAFSRFDDEMDDLQATVEDLEDQTRERKASRTDDSKKQGSDLGEADSKNVLEESTGELGGDLNVKANADDTPETIAEANHLLNKMGAKKKKTTRKKASVDDSDDEDEDVGEDDKDTDSDDAANDRHDQEDDREDNREDDQEDDGGDDEVRDDDDEASDDDSGAEDDDTSEDSEAATLDDSVSLLEDDEGTGGPSLADEDLASSNESLLSRAKVEAAQADRMSAASVDDKIHKAEQYIDAAAAERKYGSSMDPVEKTMIEQLSSSQKEAQAVVDHNEKSSDLGGAEEEVEQSKVATYVSSEAAKEDREIHEAEAREKKMEEQAKTKMLSDIEETEQIP